jgi:hypothetical protein
VTQWPNEYEMIPAGLVTNRLKLFCPGPTGGVDSKLVGVISPRGRWLHPLVRPPFATMASIAAKAALQIP